MDWPCGLVCAQTRTDALKVLVGSLLSLSLFSLLALQRIPPRVSLAVPLSPFFIPSFSPHQRADHSFLSTRAQNNYPPTCAVLPLSITISPSLCLLLLSSSNLAASTPALFFHFFSAFIRPSAILTHFPLALTSCFCFFCFFSQVVYVAIIHSVTFCQAIFCLSGPNAREVKSVKGLVIAQSAATTEDVI